VLNISLPKDTSFNSNVKEHLLEKVTMATAKTFSYAVCDAGKGARMSKFDMKDAYKTVLAPLSDLRLQGFEWLSMFFVEKKQIFDAKTTVANFAVVGNTLKSIALSKCSINENLVLRCLDDVPIISSASNSHSEQFTSCYKDLCNNIKVKLADECPRFEKAFANSTIGKVLGIWFDTPKMCWFYLESKARKVLLEIIAIVGKPVCNLLEMQELLGFLNNFSQLMPFMNFVVISLSAFQFFGAKTLFVGKTIREQRWGQIQLP
jgi:hypothetical protein